MFFHQAFMGWALWEGKEGAMQFWDFKGGHHNGSEDLNLTQKQIIMVSNI